ncbi:gluconokinase [Chitinophagaceae bacterium 26-R-25]|nr:gluconokinase [Chitinophagaceae bacterium 26-R-25]
MQYFIGIDIGTTHTKAIACEASGKVNVTYKEGYKKEKIEGIEQDADEIFQAVCRLMQQVTAFMKDKGTLAAVSFSSAMHSLVVVDEQGNALSTLWTWADNRSVSYAKKLQQSPEGKIIFEQTGTPLHPMTPLCKIAWIRDNDPALFAKAHKFISIKEYVFYKLFGQFIIDHSIASATGLFNIHTLAWSKEALQFAGIDETKLSKPVSPLLLVSGLQQRFCEQWGIGAQTSFVPGASDGCLANLGSGAIAKGEVALTIGTSGAIRQTVRSSKTDEKERLFTYILNDDYCVSGGAINNGGIVLKWWMEQMLQDKNIDDKDFNSFFDAISKIPAGAEGLVCLPYFYGERAPVWDADAKGAFVGVSAKHSQAHFMRAVAEGICFAFAQLVKILEENFGPISRIYASGGFIQSGVWVQMLANILQKKINVNTAADASAFGAVCMAMLATKTINNIEDVKKLIPVDDKEYLPDESTREVYARQFGVFDSLYEKLI